MRETLTTFFGTGLWGIIKAALLLILAFIVAKIVKNLIVKLLTKTKVGGLLEKTGATQESKDNIIEFIGKLAYLLVFLLFVPGIFQSLGMQGVSDPVLGLLNSVWGYLPNLLAAVIVLWVGFAIARLVRELLVPVFNKLHVNRIQEKAGMEVTDQGKLSGTLAYIVYVLILIPVIVAALRVLNIQAISEPAIEMLETIFLFIPNILAALIIIIVGCMIAKFAGGIVEKLIASTGLDAKLRKNLDGKADRFVLSRVTGMIVHAVLVIFFVVESFNVLHLQVISNIGNAVIRYMPYALAAVLILIACYVGNAAAQKALTKNGHTGFAMLSKCAIYGIGIFMVLSELGIAQNIVNTAFIVLISAAALAFAIAFGIGGRDFAGRTLNKIEDSFKNKPDESDG